MLALHHNTVSIIKYVTDEIIVTILIFVSCYFVYLKYTVHMYVRM